MNSMNKSALILVECDMEEKEPLQPFLLVIFGGAGDLARRKLFPTLYSAWKGGDFPEIFSILSYGRQDLDDTQFRELLAHSLPGEDEDREQFLEKLYFLYGNFEDQQGYSDLNKRIQELPGRNHILYYLAVPEAAYADIIGNISASSLPVDSRRVKIIIEKPFGRDLSGARKLNSLVASTFLEKQVYRMDHYLGKETVQNIIFFRFANGIFEPVWNRNGIDSVQITVAEDMGMDNRGGFYEKTGAIRDIFQNHLLQLLSLVAMDPPPGFQAERIRDEKIKVLRSLRPVEEHEVPGCSAAGQYIGYRDEDRVDSQSNVATFFAARVHIDTWRWAGVPFFLRTGKRLAAKSTEIVIQFKQPPLKLFRDDCRPLEPSFLRIVIQPEERIELHLGVKYPEASNMIYPVDLAFSYNETFGSPSVPPYQRLILDALAGDPSLFVRQDDVEASWSFTDPFVAYWEKSGTVEPYKAGTWGPEQAEQLVEKDGRSWILPHGTAGS
jgi:glucose-6-phosphate 1-dehydrogenase